MSIAVHHEIHDRDACKRRVNAMAPPPPQLRRHQFLAATDPTRASCPWEAPSVEPRRDYVDGSLEPASTQTYFSVDEARAVGLPPTQLA